MNQSCTWKQVVRNRHRRRTTRVEPTTLHTPVVTHTTDGKDAPTAPIATVPTAAAQDTTLASPVNAVDKKSSLVVVPVLQTHAFKTWRRPSPEQPLDRSWSSYSDSHSSTSIGRSSYSYSNPSRYRHSTKSRTFLSFHQPSRVHAKPNPTMLAIAAAVPVSAVPVSTTISTDTTKLDTRADARMQQPYHPHVLERYKVEFAAHPSEDDRDRSFSLSDSASSLSRSLSKSKLTQHPSTAVQSHSSTASNTNAIKSCDNGFDDDKYEKYDRHTSRFAERWQLSDKDRSEICKRCQITSNDKCSIVELDSTQLWLNMEKHYFSYIDRELSHSKSQSSISLVHFVSQLLVIPIRDLLTPYRQFLGFKKQIPVAGCALLSCIPVRQSSSINLATDIIDADDWQWQWFVLMVFPIRGKRWSLPKGKAEPGKTLVATAVREVKEEVDYLVSEKTVQTAAFLDVDRTDVDASRVRLYLIPDIDFRYPFRINCRGEIERISWIRLSTDFPSDDLSALALAIWPSLLTWTAQKTPSRDTLAASVARLSTTLPAKLKRQSSSGSSPHSLVPTHVKTPKSTKSTTPSSPVHFTSTATSRVDSPSLAHGSKPLKSTKSTALSPPVHFTATAATVLTKPADASKTIPISDGKGTAHTSHTTSGAASVLYTGRRVQTQLGLQTLRKAPRLTRTLQKLRKRQQRKNKR